MSLYAKYLKERLNTEVIEIDHAFITYTKVNEKRYYIVDVFVEKGYRKNGLGHILSDMVKEIAIKDGATELLGSVDLTASGVTESIAVIIADGFKYSHSSGNGMYFIKQIGG